MNVYDIDVACVKFREFKRRFKPNPPHYLRISLENEERMVFVDVSF
jgi:hypothetical protein